MVKMTELTIAQRMVQQFPSLLRRHPRRANNMQHRNVLGIAARNAVHGT